MNLLNLLHKQLKEWPEGVTVIVQDSDGEIRGQCLKNIGDVDSWAHKPVVLKSELADDYKTAFVTEEEFISD